MNLEFRSDYLDLIHHILIIVIYFLLNRCNIRKCRLRVGIFTRNMWWFYIRNSLTMLITMKTHFLFQLLYMKYEIYILWKHTHTHICTYIYIWYTAIRKSWFQHFSCSSIFSNLLPEGGRSNAQGSGGAKSPSKLRRVVRFFFPQRKKRKLPGSCWS